MKSILFLLSVSILTYFNFAKAAAPICGCDTKFPISVSACQNSSDTTIKFRDCMRAQQDSFNRCIDACIGSGTSNTGGASSEPGCRLDPCDTIHTNLVNRKEACSGKNLKEIVSCQVNILKTASCQVTGEPKSKAEINSILNNEKNICYKNCSAYANCVGKAQGACTKPTSMGTCKNP